jgi:hypothetical protein
MGPDQNELVQAIRGSVALADIFNERRVQLAEFIESADDHLTPAEWIARVTKHTGRAVSHDPQAFRQEMVVVGALALAAIESFDRRYAS